MSITKHYYRDPYGCTASIREEFKPYHQYLLRVCDPYGELIHKQTYATARGAKIALGRLSGGLMEEVTRT